MDRTVRDLDRNPFFPPERQATFGLTLGMFVSVLVATIAAIGLFVVQLDAFASTTGADPAPAPFLDPTGPDGTDACPTHHVLRFEPVTAIEVPVTDLSLASAELVVTCDGEGPHTVLSADCVSDPIGCLIVLASGDGTAPVRDYPTEAFGAPMHPDPLPYGGADPHTLSMIGRAADGIVADDIAAEGSV